MRDLLSTIIVAKTGTLSLLDFVALIIFGFRHQFNSASNLCSINVYQIIQFYYFGLARASNFEEWSSISQLPAHLSGRASLPWPMQRATRPEGTLQQRQMLA